MAAFVGIVAPPGFMGGGAHAGDYHVGDTLACAECHKRDFRISRQDINGMCLSCHGGATADPRRCSAQISPGFRARPAH